MKNKKKTLAIAASAVIGAAATGGCGDPAEVADMKVHQEKVAHAGVGSEEASLLDSIQRRDAGLTDTDVADVSLDDAEEIPQGEVLLHFEEVYTRSSLRVHTISRTEEEFIEYNLSEDGRSISFFLPRGFTQFRVNVARFELNVGPTQAFTVNPERAGVTQLEVYDD